MLLIVLSLSARSAHLSLSVAIRNSRVSWYSFSSSNLGCVNFTHSQNWFCETDSCCAGSEVVWGQQMRTHRTNWRMWWVLSWALWLRSQEWGCCLSCRRSRLTSPTCFVRPEHVQSGRRQAKQEAIPKQRFGKKEHICVLGFLVS